MKKSDIEYLKENIKERIVIDIPKGLAIGITLKNIAMVGKAEAMNMHNKFSNGFMTVQSAKFDEKECSMCVKLNDHLQQAFYISYHSLNKLKTGIRPKLKFFDHSYRLNSHSSYLVDTDMAGNGYHGRCAYCGLACVTDLGYSSWAGTTCEEREPSSIIDFPNDIRSYVHFNGLMFKPDRQVFTKPYSDVELTYADIRKTIDDLSAKHGQKDI